MQHIKSSLPMLNTPQPKTKKVVAPKSEKSEPIDIPNPSVSSIKPKFKAEQKDYKIIELDPSRWLIRQCTAVCGIDLVNGHEVSKEFIKYVNDNGNSWLNDHVKKYYKTFIGGHNFFEHVQKPELSYGFLADATLRKVEVDTKGHVSLYVDVIVCTNKEKSPDKNNVTDIENNTINTLSMGCSSDALMCSKCGIISADTDTDCSHLTRQVGRQYMGPNGLSKVSAVVWPVNEKGVSEIGINFFELSWVKTPAYRGATAAHELKFDNGDKVYFKMPNASIDRQDGWDAVNYWKNKGELKLLG